jgi:hypothetical protein
MNQNSSSRSTELAPIRRDRTLENDIDYLLTDERIGDRRRVLREAPSPALKERLYVRCEQLKAALLPARQSDVAQLIGQLFLGFGSARADADDAQAVTAQYCIALGGLPLWAIREACRKFARGSVTEAECPKWNRSFAPSSAQLSTLANAIASPLYKEIRKIDDVLTGYIPYVPDEQERQQVLHGFTELREMLREKERRERELAVVNRGSSVSPHWHPGILADAIRNQDALTEMAIGWRSVAKRRRRRALKLEQRRGQRAQRHNEIAAGDGELAGVLPAPPNARANPRDRREGQVIASGDHRKKPGREPQDVLVAPPDRRDHAARPDDDAMPVGSRCRGEGQRRR